MPGIASGWSIVDVETRLPSLPSSIVGGAVVIRSREVYAGKKMGISGNELGIRNEAKEYEETRRYSGGEFRKARNGSKDLR